MTALDSPVAPSIDTPIAYEPAWRSYLRLYGTLMRTSVQIQFQYRVSNYLYMLGMIAEPVSVSCGMFPPPHRPPARRPYSAARRS